MAAPLFDQLCARNHPGLILATGGTTGVPKLVLHDLTALLATVPVRTVRSRRTLPLMRFDHIGGLDMAWRALAGKQVLVAPPAEFTPEAVARTIARHRVEVMPATPSFLNLLLMAEIHRTHDLGSLRVVPYGAEPMPAGLLERLRAALPQVEFTQRFGTSETGALPVRNLGAGLVLREGQAGFAWKIVDDELWVQSPARALGYLSGQAKGFDTPGWFQTGDLAEQLPDGTVRVLGRREELINVGGEKVLPGEVESVLLTHPLVADCRVGSEPNAVLGQVVAADIVWRGPERDAVAVKRMLHAFISGLIARQKLPVVVRLVEVIDSTRNLKKLRLVHP
jgi:acyl-CoA synthetase (AMP-forming)/AMP-acid ligase II